MTQALGEKISVCLLTYNHAHILESTIRSVLDQSVTGFELIISDDCSTDGTWEVITRLAQQDSRIRPLRTPRNLQMAGNANFAVSHSTRPYVALLHHDDIYRNDLLEKWGQAIDGDDDVTFVFNPYGLENQADPPAEMLPPSSFDGQWFLTTKLLPRWGCLVRGTAMIRRTSWDAVGGMRPEFSLLADVDLWMRLSRTGKVGYVPEPLITVRQDRPEDYPESYKGGTWSWPRQRILCEIHATNRLETLDRTTLGGFARWQYFRLRLARETAKWLTYAVVKRRWDMIEDCDDSTTPHDPALLRLYRQLLKSVFKTRRGKTSAATKDTAE